MRLTLQVTVTVLISFVGCVLAAAEMEDPSGAPWGALSLPIALVSLIAVDRWQWIRLPGWGITILGIGAFYLAALEYLQGGLIESRLLAASHLVIYLTWLYLIQPKTARHYWWLHALAALQLALASVLTAKPWFGVSLLVAAFLGSWSLALFLVARSVETALGGEDWRELPPDNKHRRSLGAIQTGLTYDDGHRLINGRFIGNSLLLTVLGLVFSTAFFLFTPRIWIGGSAVAGDGTLASTIGFSESVTLGDIGTSLQNQEPALEVRIFDLSEQRYLNEAETVQHLSSRIQFVDGGSGEPYFRGAVLEVYADGKWERAPDRKYDLPDYANLTEELRQVLRYRQDYKLHQLGSTLLFTCGTVLTVEGDATLRPQREMWSDELQQARKLNMSGTLYRAYEIDTHPQLIHRMLQQRVRSNYGEHIERQILTPDNTERIYVLTEKLLRPNGPEDSLPNPRDAVAMVERYFREGTEYSYSLNNSIVDRTIDPVEDFLFNRKQGHCEYFASAMALIMRKAGLPARVVTGFQGGAWDKKRQAFVVQQLHAHAWVEVLVDNQWIMADPTPPARQEEVHSREGNAPESVSWNTRLSTLWSMSVQMTQDQQQATLYAPVMSLAESVSTGLPSPGEFLTQLQQFIRSPQQGLSEGSTVIAVILATCIVALCWGLYLLARRLWAWRRLAAGDDLQMRVAFFERFLAMLRRAGLRRNASQTAQEFAREVMLQLNPRLTAAGLATWPADLVARFYDVRFGAQQVSDLELKQLEGRLDELERCLLQK